MNDSMPRPETVLDFWFVENGPPQWFAKDAAFDAAIVSRFAETHRSALAGELWQWRKTPRGALAEVIVLDQFSRNMFRDDPRAFAADPLALCLAQEAIARGQDAALDDRERPFLYMPFMHSESRRIHEEAVKVFAGMGMTFEYELKHKAIIDRFGRYPHRNAALGRQSSEEELAFLQTPGSSF